MEVSCKYKGDPHCRFVAGEEEYLESVVREEARLRGVPFVSLDSTQLLCSNSKFEWQGLVSKCIEKEP